MKLTVSPSPEGFTWTRTDHNGTHQPTYHDARADEATNPYATTLQWPTRDLAVLSAVETAYNVHLWTFGHTRYAVGEGFTLCQACALKEAADALTHSDTADDLPIAQVAQGDEGIETNDTCESCDAIINPQRCNACYDPVEGDDARPDPFGARVSGLPVFRGDHGYGAVHGHCLAAAAIAGNARKTGRLAYQYQGQTYTAN